MSADIDDPHAEGNGNGRTEQAEPRPLDGLPERAIAADTALAVGMLTARIDHLELVCSVTAARVDELIGEARAAQTWRDQSTKMALQWEARQARIEKGVARLLELAGEKP
jgi:hypothetical protein